MGKKQGGRRFAELDFLRGLTLLAMIIWHLGWDLQMFYGYPWRYNEGLMGLSFRFIAPSFMVLAGISSTLAGNHGKRAGRVLAFAFLITVVTFFYDRQQVILFGILHFMGVNMWLYPYYRHWPPLLLAALAAGFLLMGAPIAGIDMPTNWLLPLGLKSFDYRSLDYFPLIPYMGYFLGGAILGPILYPGGQARWAVKLPANPLNFLGRHSLTVYVLHQPVLLMVLQILAVFGLIGK